MSTQSKMSGSDSTTELAASIFTELVCRNVVVTENAAQIKSNPENLARISFKLAQAFLRIEAETKQSSAPKNQAFEVQDVDLTSWNAKKT